MEGTCARVEVLASEMMVARKNKVHGFMWDSFKNSISYEGMLGPIPDLDFVCLYGVKRMRVLFQVFLWV